MNTHCNQIHCDCYLINNAGLCWKACVLSYVQAWFRQMRSKTVWYSLAYGCNMLLRKPRDGCRGRSGCRKFVRGQLSRLGCNLWNSVQTASRLQEYPILRSSLPACFDLQPPHLKEFGSKFGSLQPDRRRRVTYWPVRVCVERHVSEQSLSVLFIFQESTFSGQCGFPLMYRAGFMSKSILLGNFEEHTDIFYVRAGLHSYTG